MALSKLIYAFFSLSSVSTIYLLSENQKMCDDVEVLQDHSCVHQYNMNTERIDRVVERMVFLEGFTEQVWEKQK